MKRGIGRLAYDSLRIYIRIRIIDLAYRNDVEEAVFSVIPIGYEWVKDGEWITLRGDRDGDPEELYRAVCNAIWKAYGRYCEIEFEAQPMALLESLTFSSEPGDMD